MTFRRHERGNALFLILIAVALFAALSYAVTRSGRGSGNINKETNILQGAQRTQFAAAIQQAINHLKIIGNCTDEQLDFSGNNGTSMQGDGTPYDYTNPSSPADGSCNVFSAAGGGVIPQDFYHMSGGLMAMPGCGGGCLDPYSWIVTPSRVVGHGSEAGTAGTDLIIWLGRLSREQCLNVNTALGITNPAGEPPYDTFDCQGPQFTGTYGTCSNPFGDEVPELAGKNDFCVRWAADSYIQVHVLLSR
jgi:hypothetical protein